jgi:hypothetical protein
MGGNTGKARGHGQKSYAKEFLRHDARTGRGFPRTDRLHTRLPKKRGKLPIIACPFSLCTFCAPCTAEHLVFAPDQLRPLMPDPQLVRVTAKRGHGNRHGDRKCRGRQSPGTIVIPGTIPTMTTVAWTTPVAVTTPAVTPVAMTRIATAPGAMTGVAMTTPAVIRVSVTTSAITVPCIGRLCGAARQDYQQHQTNQEDPSMHGISSFRNCLMVLVLQLRRNVLTFPLRF